MVGFFEHQDRARRNTRFLLVLMALGVLAMGLAFYGVLYWLEHATGYSPSKAATPHERHREVLLWSILGTAIVVLAASSLRMLSLRGGGSSIAEMLGGRLVSGSPRDVLERRLVNVVEEMAIASGVPVPQVFVLDAERGINAFAAGDALEDAAIAVTRGGLEKLTREELQGVVAHEFSHVLNGDMRLNIRLMGIVFGIVCIGLFGRFLMRMGTSSSSYVSGRRRRGGPGPVFLLAGLAVFVIGTIGEFVGNLIKAAVSRQREFLADASAVQFTRNPSGIAGALKKIGGFSAGAEVTGAHAEEASHFFFGDIHKRLFAHSVLATHPPLAERIARIEPSFRGQFQEVPDGIAEPEDLPVSGLAPVAARVAAAPPQMLDPQRVVGQVGAVPADVAQLGRGMIDALPPVLREASESPFSAVATVYAMLLAEDATVQEAQLGFVSQLSSARLAQEALRLRDAVRGLPRRDRLSLAELLAPALRQLNEEQRTSFVHTVQALVRADAKVSIFEYVLTELLKERFGSGSGRPRVAHHRSLKAVRAELELVLSLLAHAGSLRGSDAESAFATGANRLGSLALTLLGHSERLLSGLGPALAALRVLSPQRCAEVVDACAHVVLADRRVTEDEATLLRAVCGALGCPLPPLNLTA